MEKLTSERLQDNLTRLKLTRAAEVLDTVADQAKEKKSSFFLSSITFLKKRLQPKKSVVFKQQ